MYEFIPADHNPYMCCELSHTVMERVEEDEIAGAEIARVHLGSCLKLFRDGARHLQPVSIEHIPDEPAAIEPGGIASAISTRDAAK